MANLTADERRKLEEKIQNQEDEVYGTEYTDGGEVDTEDTEEMLEDVVGDDVDTTKPFSIAEEVEDDEEARHSKPSEE